MFNNSTSTTFNSFGDDNNVTTAYDTIGSSSINITDFLPTNVYEYYGASPSTAPIPIARMVAGLLSILGSYVIVRE